MKALFIAITKMYSITNRLKESMDDEVTNLILTIVVLLLFLGAWWYYNYELAASTAMPPSLIIPAAQTNSAPQTSGIPTGGLMTPRVTTTTPRASTATPRASTTTNSNVAGAAPASCQSLQTKYSIVPRASWGSLTDTDLRNWWDSHGCNDVVSPTTSKTQVAAVAPGTSCQNLQSQYKIVPRQNWGTLTDAILKAWYDANSCNDVLAPTQSGSNSAAAGPVSCQSLQTQYGIVPNQNWGTLTDAKLKAWWDANSCNGTSTTPVPAAAAPTSCQSLQNQYGIVPNQSWGSLTDPAIKSWWDANACNGTSTTPVPVAIAAAPETSCQSLQQQYGIVPMQSWGALTDSALQAWWNAHSCNGGSTGGGSSGGDAASTCQSFVGSYGIQKGSSWGSAPSSVITQWGQLNCDQYV